MKSGSAAKNCNSDRFSLSSSLSFRNNIHCIRRETIGGGRIHVQIRFDGLGSSTISRYRRFPRFLVGRGEIERWEAKKGVNKMSAYAADAILLRSGALSPYK